MSVRRLAVSVGLCAGLILGAAGPAYAAPHVGGSCPRVGATATSHGVKLVCKKNAAGKLVWKKRASSGQNPSSGQDAVALG